MLLEKINNSAKSDKSIFYQMFFWLFIFIFYTLHYYRLIGGDYVFMLFSSKELLIAMLSFYLWPGRWLGNRGAGVIFISISLWIVAIFLIWSFFTYLLSCRLQNFIGFYPIRFKEYLKAIIQLGPWGIIKEWKAFVYEILVLFILSISPRLLKMSVDHRMQKAKLERDHIEWELQLLKSQLNPPMLFNTLNKIYMVLDTDSNKGKDLILRLSYLMRFTLYDSRSEFIEVKKEIHFVNDFLILMKECFGENVCINWDLEEISEPYIIRPLLITPIIDRAFNRDGNLNRTLSSVSVRILVDDKNFLELNIECKLKNQLQNGTLKPHSESNDELHNVKKRLNMYYKNRYYFRDQEISGIRNLYLKLDLKSY